LSGDQVITPYTLHTELKDILAERKMALSWGGASAERYYQLGQTLLLAAPYETGSSNEELRCEALSAFEQAAERSPHAALYHVAAADTQAQLLLAKSPCPGTARITLDLLRQELAWAENSRHTA